MRDFLRAEAGGGLALVLGSVAALLWVNVIDAGGYASFWATHINIGIGSASIDESLGHWVNDGLMTLFFFLISLEIKRELVTGELRHPKRAALPIIAALGGVVTPIVIFLAITGGHDAAGWGIPMATDAAFAIGVLALLGDRVGVGVKLFLVTIAVVDDVAAILVIAVAYTDHLSLGWLALAVAGLAAVVAVRLLGVRRILVYIPLGLFVWVATFESGIHATLAGVALALITPAVPVDGRDVLGELEHALHPWVNFAILPLFALANAGVKLGGGELSDPDGRRLALAVALGLVVGKFIGITGATWAALRRCLLYRAGWPTENPHVIVTRGTKASRGPASTAYLSHVLDDCGFSTRMIRSTRLVELVNTLDPKLVAAAFGMDSQTPLIYLGDHVDPTRLTPNP